MVTVGVDGNSLQADSQPKSVGLIWGLAAALVCIHWMNWRNSHSSYHDDNTTNIGIDIIIINLS